jgi:hypothetical protein
MLFSEISIIKILVALNEHLIPTNFLDICANLIFTLNLDRNFD